MKWVEESEVMGQVEEASAEACVFCHKTFATHHGYTAHLRLHGDDLNDHVLNIISAASKPMGIAEIQALSNISVDVRNSISRLMKQNKIRRVQRGRYSANKGIAAIKQPATKKQVAEVKNFMVESEWDALILAQLKKHPDLYKRMNDEVVAGIKKYLAFSAGN